MGARAEKWHRARAVASTGNAGQAVIAAPIVIAALLAAIRHHQIGDADRVGQCKREYEDAGEGHALRIARSHG